MATSKFSRAPVLVERTEDHSASLFLEAEDRLQAVIDPLNGPRYYSLELPGLNAVLASLRRSGPVHLHRLITGVGGLGPAANDCLAYFTDEGPKVAFVPAIITPAVIEEIFRLHGSLTALGHRAGLSFSDGRFNPRPTKEVA